MKRTIPIGRSDSPILALVALLFAAGAVAAGAQEGRARIALFGLEAGASAARILPVTDAVADTMALTLALLGRFEVVRLDTADSLADTKALREYCAANRIDQAIGGSGTPRTGGGFTFRLGVYDRHKDRVTLVREGSSSGLLDVFEVTDELVTALLEALSGTHIGFGSLTLQRRGEQGEYSVLIDGTPIGTDVAEVERLLIGRRTVTVRQRRLLREVEIATSVVQVPEDGRVSVSFEIPGIMEEEQRELDRLMGIAKGGWNERARSKEVEAALERGIQLLLGAKCSTKLLGMAEGWRTEAALHALVRCEWRVQDGLPQVDLVALEVEVERFTATAALAEEGANREAAIDSLQRVFALVRLAAINDFASGRWDPGIEKLVALERIVIDARAPGAADEGFWGDDALMRARYAENQAGKTGAASRLREDLGKELQAAQDLFRDFTTVKGSELVVISDPPGRTVTVNGKRQGETPLRVRNLRAGTAPVVLSDIWYEKSEQQVALSEGRSYLFLGEARPAKSGLLPEATPAECFGDSVRFSWSKVPEARLYTLQLIGSVGWTTEVIEQVTGIRSTVYTLKRPLEPGRRYSYRVRPVSADGTPGPWGAASPLEGQLVWERASAIPQLLAIDTSSARSIVYQDRMWAMGGHTSTTVASSDGGYSWRREIISAPFGKRGDFGLVEFKGRLWLIGGDTIVNLRDPGGLREYFNDVWSTADGIEWRLEVAHAPFSPRAHFSCLVLNGRIWVIGGNDAHEWRLDVWSSEDGIAWRREGAPLEVETIQPGVVFQDRMWHMARSPTSPRSVFSSTDGIHWDLANQAPVSTTQEELHSVFNEKMWLIGGRYPGEVFKFRVSDEMWYSSDGHTWKKSIPASSAYFPARHNAQGYEYHGKLWVMFGNDNLAQLDGIWCAEPAPWP